MFPLFVSFLSSAFGSIEDCGPILVLERSTNKNRVLYSYDGGNKIDASWELLEKEGGKLEKLTHLEGRMAYGAELEAKEDDASTYSANAPRTFSIVSAKKIKMELKKDETGCWGAHLNSKPVRRVYVEISGGGLFSKIKNFKFY